MGGKQKSKEMFWKSQSLKKIIKVGILKILFSFFPLKSTCCLQATDVSALPIVKYEYRCLIL
jgi:hypothetical protein